MKIITCPYCGNPAKLITGKTVYPHRKDLYSLQFWNCNPCGARVGVHKGTTNPLGRLAKPELRTLKTKAHAAFDPLWRDGDMKRKEAYRWLADKLEIEYKACHIGMFDIDMCKQVIDLCNKENGHLEQNNYV